MQLARLYYNSTMKVLNAEETRALLPYAGLTQELIGVMRDRASGLAYAPARTSVPLANGGLLLLMPAADLRIGITKLVTVHTANSAPGSNIPVVQAEVIVMDASTGERLGILNGEVVTGRRTSALSLLAAQRLAPNRSGPLLVIGAGTQARYHIEAFVEAMHLREVYISSRTRSRAEQLAEYVRTLSPTLHVSVMDDPSFIMPDAALIVTTTTGTRPVIPRNGAEVRSDAFIAAVGAFTPEMAELPPELVRRSRLYADTLDGALVGAGDFIQAGVDWTTVVELQAAIDKFRPATGPVIFKSVGHALWDLAAARLAFPVTP